MYKQNKLKTLKTIGILGSGIVAKTLGAGFIKHGYKVKLGTYGKYGTHQSDRASMYALVYSGFLTQPEDIRI